MIIDVREMEIAEPELIIDYFHGATPEFLEMLGVDPTRVRSREVWREHFFCREYALPIERRSEFGVIWRIDGD